MLRLLGAYRCMRVRFHLINPGSHLQIHILPCIYPIHSTRRRNARSNLPYHIPSNAPPLVPLRPRHTISLAPPHTPSFPNSRPDVAASRIHVISSENIGTCVSLEITNISFLFPISLHVKRTAWAEKLVYPIPRDFDASLSLSSRLPRWPLFRGQLGTT